MILVTGATGLVGAHLCLALLGKKEKVVALTAEKKERGFAPIFIEREKETLFDEIIFRKAPMSLPQLIEALEGIKKYIIVQRMFQWPIIKKTTPRSESRGNSLFGQSVYRKRRKTGVHQFDCRIRKSNNWTN